jgi:superfamily II DNA or RNA helicase
VELRRHQRLALEALGHAWDEGRDRAWVVLPPGAGKTLVGLESIRRLVVSGAVGRAVVLGPNTAIQAQWLAQAATLGLDAGDDRDLGTTLTALTYQAVAVFDADAEVDDAGTEGQELLSRLHDNGRALLATMRAAGPLLLVLDECHHLLEVWGRLLAELLEQLPQARVLGLTATPPAALTVDQASLVEELFGGVAFEASIPAVVREGDLAPFAELVWLTTPTSTEQDWLASGALRFHELTTQLCDPAFGTVPFLSWLDLRFVDRPGDSSSWVALTRQEPELCSAALRLHRAGLLRLPPGARLLEEHRHDPTADDWLVLVDDWLRGSLARSDDPDDQRVVAAIRAALPSVGYVLTRAGIRRGRSTVDRVLARSESKTTATVEIVDHELRSLGDRMRTLVLCDHERAGATLPADLDGVLDQQSGSAYAVLAALVADPSGADALLVTGSTVAGAPATLRALVDHLAATAPDLAPRLLVVEEADGVARLDGPWTSRVWVAHVTRFFEAGGTRVLVGTRGLLGEGWDARGVTGLVDLTAVTTTTAVVQTRGRALRTDPAWPEKVALNWSVVCVAEGHPRGDNDWSRLVRKHSGFFGVDEDGDVVDGVAHIDPAFSPYAPPPAAEFDALNARMVVRAEDRDVVRERWRVGEPYVDRSVRAVRIRPGSPGLMGTGTGTGVPEVVAGERALDVRSATATSTRWTASLLVAAVLVVLGVVVGAAGLTWWIAGLGGLALLGSGSAYARVLTVRGRQLLRTAAEPPSVARVACAVADGLMTAGLVARGSDAVEVTIDRDGEYRCLLAGVDEEQSAVFATALDEAVSPILLPRYVLPRWVVDPAEQSTWDALGAARGRLRPDGLVWHAVPTVLGVNADRARLYAVAWRHWVGGGEPLFTGSPEGTGMLAAQQGSDPFAVSTVIRRQWS